MENPKSKKYDLDKTNYDVVIDCNESTGFPDCLKNLEKLLIDIYEESNSKLKLSTKLLVLKSKLGFNGNEPYRYSKDVVKTLSGLLKEYSEWGEEFDLEKVKEKRKHYFEGLEKQREKIDAWGPFMYVTRVKNELNQVNKIIKNSKNKNEAESKIKEKQLDYTYNHHYRD